MPVPKSWPRREDGRVNWEEVGYLMAKGKLGTGWMAFNERSLKEMIEKGETPLAWAEGWTETEQWLYEVGDRILEEVGSMDADEFFEAEGDWEYGYARYIREFARKKGVKIPADVFEEE